MGTCLIDEVEYEISYSTYGKSRSSEDLTSQLSGIKFLRKGAIRKRQASQNPEKRHSINSSNIYNEEDLCQGFHTHRPSILHELFLRSPSKTSNHFIRVIDVFQNGKKDFEKEDNRKKSWRLKYPDKKTSVNGDSQQAITTAIDKIAESIINNVRPGNWLVESSWTDIVIKKENFNQTECNKQAAIWELIQTEASCLNFFLNVVEIFLPVFNQLQNQYDALFPSDRFELFGNIEQLYNSHLELWEHCISKPLLKSRADGEPLDILLMKKGFLSISSIFASYNLFMQMQGQINKILQEQEKINIYMREYIKWTKSYDKADRFGILSLSTNPFQRITKYKILLDRIKEFSSEGEKPILDEMIKAVHDFLEHINSVVIGEKRLEEIKEKLVEMPLVKYDYIDIFQLIDRQFILFDISKSLSNFPDRVLIHAGRLKLYLNKNKTIDVECFLFNDLFLICKPHRKDRNKLEIIKSPIRLDKFIAKLGKENSMIAYILNDFMTVNGVMVFVGSCDEVKLWMDKYHKARTAFMNKFECPLRVPLKYFFQLSENLNISPLALINGESQKSKRADSDSVSEHSNCIDYAEKQLSVDIGPLIREKDNDDIINQFTSINFNETTTTTYIESLIE